MKRFLLIIAVLAFLSCSKSQADQTDKSKPKLTIIAPSANSSIYHTGDPLCFTGNVLDESALKSVQLKLFKAANMNAPVIEYYFPVNDKFLYVEQKTIVPSSLNGDCILQFEATDIYNNKAVSTLNFSGN